MLCCIYAKYKNLQVKKMKSTQIVVRVTPSERKQVKEQAAAKGLSVSDAIRKSFNLLPPA
jgi:predicted DNA binding CopG/RHH family protein